MRTAILSLGLAGLVAAQGAKPIVCDHSLMMVMNDMHDGDQKMFEVTALPVRGYTYTITPHNNKETWKVEGEWDALNCNASVDFNVPGKPGPPPVALTLTYFEGTGGVKASGGAEQPPARFAVFSDPSGTIAPSAKPLNAWVAN